MPLTLRNGSNVTRYLVVLSHPVQNHRTTLVEGVLFRGNNDTEGTKFIGESRRDPEDKFNPEIGEKLATARALESAARRLRKEADGAVRNADSIKSHRQKLREKKKVSV